jgi:hypothetical protein
VRALFRPEVRDPALKAPRGEARIRALFERWLEWGSSAGGCLLVASAFELDEPARARRTRSLRPAMNAPPSPHDRHHVPRTRKPLPFGPTNGAAGTTPLEGPGSARCSRSTRPDAADAEIAM